MGKFRDHGVLIYLNRELYRGFIRLQADKDLGRSFAGLRAFSEGLFRLGYITKAQYLQCVEKYSTPLGKEPTQLTLSETPGQAELAKLDKTFGQVVQQWSFHPDQKWRAQWAAEAKKYGELPNAKRLLALMVETKK